MEYGLASTWLLCLLLTVMNGFTPVEMVNHTLRAGAHCGAVLLFVYPVSRLLGGFGLTKKLLSWLAKLVLGAVVLTYVSAIIWPLGVVVWPVDAYAYHFFSAPILGRPNTSTFSGGRNAWKARNATWTAASRAGAPCGSPHLRRCCSGSARPRRPHPPRQGLPSTLRTTC